MYEESRWENLGTSYKVCIATGIVLLCFFYYFAFFATGVSNHTNNGAGIMSVLVCLSPAASGLMILTDQHLASKEQAIITAMLVIHLLSMISIVMHIVKKIPVPKHALVWVSRVWTFTSIGLAIFIVIMIIFPDLMNRNRDSR